MQRTLSIIKPDGVARGLIGNVIQRIEKLGLKIVAMKMVHLTLGQAQGFYAVHRERPFFQGLTSFMSSGPAVVMVLEGDNAIARWRELMGATDHRKAAEGTLRREFATDIEKNVVHGSDAPETAAFHASKDTTSAGRCSPATRSSPSATAWTKPLPRGSRPSFSPAAR